jgi:hypothetical protein
MADVPRIKPTRGLSSVVITAGTSVQVIIPASLGGYIFNPASAAGQRLNQIASLYVDPTGPANTTGTGTTVEIAPGQIYYAPSETLENGIWANSRNSGHTFIGVQFLLYTPAPAQPVPGDFPPFGPTGVDKPIPSYLYQEYSDDDDLQAFVVAYNSMMQDIIDTFRTLNLPIYVQNDPQVPIPVSGALLDWVGEGIYGYPRPSIGSSLFTLYGPYNTMRYNQNQFVYNAYGKTYPIVPSSLVNDDIYRRCLTWHISKRECKQFSIQWLKKRVGKFIYGPNGTQPNIDQTYQISVTFGPYQEVTIRFILGIRTIINGAMYNNNEFTYNNMIYNELDSIYTNLPSLPNVQDFANALRCGVLELPFQYTYDVVIG